MIDDIELARRAAYAAAIRLGPSRGIGMEVINAAERAVMRQLLCRLLPDGEAGYWRLVEQEVSK